MALLDSTSFLGLSWQETREIVNKIINTIFLIFIYFAFLIQTYKKNLYIYEKLVSFSLVSETRSITTTFSFIAKTYVYGKIAPSPVVTESEIRFFDDTDEGGV